jgi:ATP-binding cassette subfamily B protein
MVIFAIAANALTLWLPKLLSHGVDTFLAGQTIERTVIIYAVTAGVIFLFTTLQNILQTLAAEKVAVDLRTQLVQHISLQTYADVQSVTPAKLLTNITSDIDNVKSFVSMAFVTMVSSVFLIVGGGILLVSTHLRLGLVVFAVIPVIGFIFGFVLQRVRALFTKSREVIDWLNRVIEESIIGAALVRVLHTEKLELFKFNQANADARRVGTSILRQFASMIPAVTFMSNLAALIILVLGGHYVINGSFSFGDFAAFNSYLVILIFPIFMLGFMSNIIAQAQAAYVRIHEVLSRSVQTSTGTQKLELKGELVAQDVSLSYGDKKALHNVNFNIQPGNKVAILGPTAAGKTQLLQLLIGLTQPTAGTITIDGQPLSAFDQESFYQQVGLVFQDSVLFNLSIRDNIAFNANVSEENLTKAIETAELKDFVSKLPEGLDTLVSERGTSLSGGQKQRIMLARALALNPKLLLLDDFTARVDATTEQRILANLQKNYPALTLVSVTQKIAAIEEYDQIIVLMEGEIVAMGKHAALMQSSPEYVQIYNSQQSTSSYELSA